MYLRKGRGRRASTSANKGDADEAACGGLGDAALLSSGLAEDINAAATIVKRNPAPLRKVALTRSSKKPSLYVQTRNSESATFNTYLHYSFDAVMSHYLIARCQNELPAMESICFTYAVLPDEYVPCCSFLLFIPFVASYACLPT